ncbi:cytochrome P450 4d1-like isoform X1 [Clytia hemisphaerica]
MFNLFIYRAFLSFLSVHLSKMLELVIYIFTSILALLLSYLLYERVTSKTNHIPQPWSWPFLKHYPYFVEKDHVKLYADFAEPFRKAGKEFFRVNNLSLPEQVVLLNPEHPKLVLGRPDLFVRSRALNDVIPFFEHGLLNVRGDQHRRQKKLLSQAFTPAMLSKYLAASNKVGNDKIQKWHDLAKQHTDDTIHAPAALIDVLADYTDIAFTVASKSLVYMPEQDYQEFTKALLGVTDLLKDGTFWKVLFAKIPFVKYLPFGTDGARQKSIKMIDTSIRKVIEKKRQMIINSEEGSDDNDLVGICIRGQLDQSKIDETPLTDLEIRDNLVTFLIGAFDTTSSCLTWTTYAIAKHPDIQKKLREEINQVVEDFDNVTYTDIANLKYLDMVIKESLRYYNASIRVGRLAAQDCHIGDTWIPKGQMIKTVFSLFHMNEKTFPEPEKFDPERFREPVKIGSWLAFGYGPYSCIGKKFALNEIKTVLVKVVANFQLSLKNEPKLNRRIKVGLFNEEPIHVLIQPTKRQE